MDTKKALLRIVAVSALALTAALPLPAPAQESVGGNITDSRDGQRYRTVKIGKDTWMAENLNYKTDSSYCYDNADSTCAKYGWLYTWETAKKACPRGWHLPSRQEWDDLVRATGDVSRAGKMLKSKTGWNYVGKLGRSGNGTDTYGFSALPGGIYSHTYGFCCIGDVAMWWSASEYDADNAHRYFLHHVIDQVYLLGRDHDNKNGYDRKSSGYYVRCVKD